MRIILFVVISILVMGSSYAEKANNDIKSIILKRCGAHPVISYLTELESNIIGEKMLNEAKECASADATFSWLDFSSENEVSGCLESKFSRNKEYIQQLAIHVSDAKSNTQGQLKSYDACVNRIREGSSVLSDKDAFVKIGWSNNSILEGMKIGMLMSLSLESAGKCGKCTSISTHSFADNSIIIENKCESNLRLFTFRSNCESTGSQSRQFSDFTLKSGTKTVLETQGFCAYGMQPVDC